MSSIPTLPGIASITVHTRRLNQHVLACGPADGVPVVFIHGNASSATFWEETMLALPKGYRAIAPDLRGYGDTEDKLVDATRGMQDWVDDLTELFGALGIDRYHVAGWSLGGGVVWGLIGAHGKRVRSATVLAPVSPFGFGGTKDAQGTPCAADFAGSGGGTVSPTFVQHMAAGDRSSDNPQASPRVVMNSFYWKPPFKAAREEAFLSSMLSEKTGGDRYPGDFVASPNWPNVAPGKLGPINAMSPAYAAAGVVKLLAATPKPTVLWVRGADDQIVSDMSLFDFATLGKLGAVPGWPGDDVCPPQPMVGQTRAVLQRYAAAGGAFREAVYENCGHAPHLEHAARFNAEFAAHLAAN